MSKIIHTSGKRKKAVARVTLRKGNGIIRFNKVILTTLDNEMYSLKIQEPLLLAGDLAKKVNISIKTHGGGMNGQAEAARLAVSKALVEFSKDDELEKAFSEYDRHLLVADVRQKEVCKPNDSKARAKRQKSYR